MSNNGTPHVRVRARACTRLHRSLTASGPNRGSLKIEAVSAFCAVVADLRQPPTAQRPAYSTVNMSLPFDFCPLSQNLSGSRFRAVQCYDDPTMAVVADQTRSED